MQASYHPYFAIGGEVFQLSANVSPLYRHDVACRGHLGPIRAGSRIIFARKSQFAI
jgi:hypothetical protein